MVKITQNRSHPACSSNAWAKFAHLNIFTGTKVIHEFQIRSGEMDDFSSI